MDPLPDFDLWFPPPPGDVSLDDPFQFLLEPERDLSVPEGVSDPIPSSTIEKDTIEEGRGTVMNGEVRPSSDLGIPSNPSLNISRDNIDASATPSTLLPWEDVLDETTAMPAFPVFDGFSVDVPLGATNKDKSTVHSDAVLEDAKVAKTSSTGPVSFKDGNNNGNVLLSPNNIENHLVSSGEYGARADSNNSVGGDSNSEQPISQTVAACESYDRYLNRVYRAYLKKGAEIEAKDSKSQTSRNHLQVNASEIQPGP